MKRLLLMAFVAAPLVAQQPPIVADRPGFADGPATVGARRFQLEAGFETDGSDRSIPALLRYGISDAVELRIEGEPLAVGFKLRLREDVALLASAQREEAELRLLGELDLGNDLALVPNVGVAIAEGEGATVVVAASLEKELGNAIPFVDFELRAGGGDASAIVDGGVAWIVGTEMQLDVAVGIEVEGDGWFVTAGISRRF